MNVPSYPFEGLRRGHYQCILADPPWQFKSYTALPANWRDIARDARAIEKHYECMDKLAIAALPIREIAAPNCHLFLWTTGPMLPHSLEVMEAWGFRYSTVAFNWVKLARGFDPTECLHRVLEPDDFHTGLGLTTRKNTEIVLLGRRGSPRRVGKDVRELLFAPVRAHSEKPREIHDRVERYCAGPYVELFACESYPGWTTWGRELAKFVHTTSNVVTNEGRHRPTATTPPRKVAALAR